MGSVKPDRTLALACLFLILIGALSVYSSSYYQAMRRAGSSTYYLVGHLKRLLVGLGFFLLGFFVPYYKIRRVLLPGFIVLTILLVATLIIGAPQFGARRTILIGSFGLQVSEFVRIWIIFFLANLFSLHPEVPETGKGMVMAILMPLFLILLVALQPSISVALISFMSLLVILIYSRIRLKLLVPILGIGIVLFSTLILTFPYALPRLDGLLGKPSYQVKQSLIAIGSGGIFGRGPGAGLQKFLFLPRIHNDFIFAHIAEEFGFVGSLLLFLLYCEIFLRGIAIAQSITDEFPRLLVLGLNATIFIIFLMHVGVNLGLLPPTGIPLPFISYGGWALSANLFSVGIMLQLSKVGPMAQKGALN